MTIQQLRERFHRSLCQDIVRTRVGPKCGNYPNFADSSSQSSVAISFELLKRIGCSAPSGNIVNQAEEILFEGITREFIGDSFQNISHLRSGSWTYDVTASPQFCGPLTASIRGDYVVKPDVVVVRHLVSDSETNRDAPSLYAGISCKWTLGHRAELINLIRNRKGKLPCAVAITAEPMPTRIASLALGTGDIDCVYHIALPELEIAVEKVADGGQLDMLRIMVDGRRLRDVSDLPFDLAI